MPVLEEHAIRVTGDTAGAENAFKQLESSINSKLQGIANSTANASKMMAAEFISNIGGAIKEVSGFLLEIGTMFDDAFDRIRVGTGKTGEALEGLQQSFRNVSTSVPSDLDSVSVALTKLSQLTGATGKTLEDLAATQLNLARITGTSLGPQVENTTKLFNKWTISAKDQVASLDFLFKVSQQTGTSVDRIAGIMTRAATPLKNLGFSFESTAVMVGQLDKAGINVDGVMMGLTRSFAKLAKSGKDPEQAFENLIKKIAGAKTESEATSIALKIFGARAGGEFAAAVRSGALSVDQLVNTIKGSDETINKASAETADFAEQWQIFKNKVVTALEPIGSAIFSALGKIADYIQPVLPYIQELANKFQSLSPSVQAAIGIIGGIATLAGPIVVIFGQISGAITSIITLFGGAGAAAGGLGAALSALAGPVGIIIAVVAALGVAYATNFLGIRDIVNEVVTSVVALLKEMWEGIKSLVSAIMEVWTPMWQKFKATVLEALQPLISEFQKHRDVIMPILAALAIAITGPVGAIVAFAVAWKNNWNNIRETTQSVIGVLTSIIKNYSGFFKDVWEGIVIIIKTVVKVISEYIAALIDVFSGIGKALKGDWSGAFEDLKSAAGHVWEAIIALIKGAVELIIKALQAAWELIKANAITAWQLFGDAIKSAWNAVIAFWTESVPRAIGMLLAFFVKFPENLPGYIAKAWEIMKEIFNKGLEFIKTIGELIWGALKDWLSKVPGLVLEMGLAILEFLGELPDKVWSLAKTIGSKIWEGFKEGIDKKSPSGPEKDVTEMGTGIVQILTSTADKVGEPAYNIGKSIHEKFIKAFSGLTKSTKEALDSWISEMSNGLKLTEDLWKSLDPRLRKNLINVAKAVKEETNTINQILLAHIAALGRVFDTTESEWKRLPAFVQKYIQATHQTIKIYGDQIILESANMGATTTLNVDKVTKAFEKMNRDLAREGANIIFTMSGFEFSTRTMAALTLAVEKLDAAITDYNKRDETGKIEEKFIALGEAFVGLVRQFDDMADELRIVGDEKIRFVTQRVKETLDTLPPAFKATAEKILSEWQDGQNRLLERNNRTMVTFREQFAELVNYVGEGMAGVIVHVLQAYGKLNTEAMKKWSDTAEGIVMVLSNVPGKVGDKLAQVTRAVLDWINKIDNILKGLHKIWNSIPDGLGAAIESLIGIFKKAQQTVVDTVDTMSKKAKDAAMGTKNATGDMATSTESASSKMSNAFGMAAAAFTGFVAGLSTGAATGSKAVGAMVGAITGALSGLKFGPWGAIIGGIGGLLGGLFGGGKSAAQKEQERLQLEKLRNEVAQSAQDIVNAALDGFNKALTFLTNLDDFTKVSKEKIGKFFKQLTLVLQYFIEVSQVWGKDALTKAKDFADSFGPIVDAITNAPAVFENIGKYLPGLSTSIDDFFKDLGIIVQNFSDLAETIPNDFQKRASRFADRCLPIVEVISNAVEGLAKIKDFKDVPKEAMDEFAEALKAVVIKMTELSDEIWASGVKAAARFAERVGIIVNVLQPAVDGLTAVFSFKGPEGGIHPMNLTPGSSFNGFFESIKQIIEGMANLADEVSNEMLSKAMNISNAITPIAAALKAWADAAAAVRGYTAIAADVWDQVTADFDRTLYMIDMMLASALEYLPKSELFRDTITAIADNFKTALAAMGDGLSAAASAFGGVVGSIEGGMPFPGASGPGGSGYGGSGPFTPQAAGASSPSSYTFNITVDASNLREVQDLITLFETLRSTARARTPF